MIIKYLDEQGVSNIGEKLKANKTAIEGTLDTISTLSGKVEGMETNLQVIDPEKVVEALEEGYNGAI